VVVSAVGGAAGGQARLWQGGGGTRRGEPERAGIGISGGVTCDTRRRAQASGELCFCGGRRGRNWLAAFSAGGAPARGTGGAEEDDGHLYAFCIARPGWTGNNFSGRQGCS